MEKKKLKNKNLKITEQTREEHNTLALKYAGNIRKSHPEYTDQQIYECVMKAGRGKLNPAIVKNLVMNNNAKLDFEKREIF